MRTLLAITIAFTLTNAAQAMPPVAYADWPKGPVKWLMTSDDQKAWRRIDNDADARQFIALFWARRDPSPGTPQNEYRDEFDHRVALADLVFTRNGTRGALTDPGRVYILLGEPAASSVPRFSSVAASGGGNNASSLPQSIAYFRYPRSARLGLADQTIRFVSLVEGPYVLSPQGNTYGALDEAMRRAIVSPALRTAPDWAAATPSWQRFQVTLLHASTSSRGPEIPAILPQGVAKAVNDVRSLLPYKSYSFVDSVAFSAQSMEPATSKMRAPGGKAYRVVLRFGETGATLEVDPFRVERNEGGEVMSTNFAIKPGETVSVGASNGDEATEALLFFVTWIAN